MVILSSCILAQNKIKKYNFKVVDRYCFDSDCFIYNGLEFEF